MKTELSSIDYTKLKGICFDSRLVTQDSLFVAINGTLVDGHNYIDKAIENGATTIVCETLPKKIKNTISYIQVTNTSQTLGYIANKYYDNPSSKLKLVGVTGTNGKTTIATLLYRLFKELGYKVGLISTIRYCIDEEEEKSTYTTPDNIKINQLLKKMVEQECTYCFMEVSSHSIIQERISGLHFSGGIFTNITHDHLDYHKTFSEYLKVKKKFFDQLPKEAFALSNIDDKNGQVVLQNTQACKKYYSLKSLSNYKAKIIEQHFDGMLLEIENKEVWVNLIGEFNVYNLLAIYGSAINLGEGREDVLKMLSKSEAVQGRFECITLPNGTIAIIDYAHTPDALKNVLNTINKIRTHNEQLICVVGAGGDRDKEKRAKMGKEAVESSNKVILTSDNPRFENPESIIKDMQRGIELPYKQKVLVITDRHEAIKTACMLAKEKDIILIAGKGHETYQEIKGVKYNFNDKEILEEVRGD